MKNIAIFGCGQAGRSAYFRLRSKCKIATFLDNDPGKHGTRIFGVPVHDPARYDYSNVDHVFIASMYFDEMLGQLLELRVPSSKIEYLSEEVLMRSSSRDAAGGWGVSNYIHAVRRLFYVPFRLLR